MSTQRHNTPIQKQKRPAPQARTPRPRPQREPEPETYEDADMCYDDDLSAIPIANVLRRYDTETPPTPRPQQAMTRRGALNVEVYQDYALGGNGTRIPARRSRAAPAPTPSPAPRRHTTQAPPTSKQQHAAQVKLPRLHWLVYVGVTMAIMVALWVLISTVVNAYVMVSNNLTYGYPRTYQCDAVVGHADSAASPSHFLALNLHNHLEVIEFPGGDASHTKIYVGPTLVGQGDDLIPVTLTFQDVTGDGRPDMLMHFGGQTAVWINTGSAFRLATPSDHITS